jgi:hypothetical protein
VWQSRSVRLNNHIKFLGQLNNYRSLREDLSQVSVTSHAIIKPQSELIWNVSLLTKHTVQDSGMLIVIWKCWWVKNWLEITDDDIQRLIKVTGAALAVFDIDITVTRNRSSYLHKWVPNVGYPVDFQNVRCLPLHTTPPIFSLDVYNVMQLWRTYCLLITKWENFHGGSSGCVLCLLLNHSVIPLSVVRHVRCLFHSEFAAECDLVGPLSFSSIFSFS